MLYFRLGNSTGRPTRYRIWHFFNNSNTNEDIAMKFEQEYVCCVRNVEECVCSVSVACLIVMTRNSSPPGSRIRLRVGHTVFALN